MSSKTAAIQSTVVLSNTTQTTSVKQGTKSSQVGAMSYTDMWLVASTLPSTRKWHHLAYVFDGLKHYFYVDGALTATSNQISKVAPVTALDVGRSNPASEYFKGYIDEVRIYRRKSN
jgi:hypothetical protein